MNALTPIVKIQNVSRRFGKTQALDNVDLEVVPGRIIGLLGSNGSGKSTLLRHMIGLYLPNAGNCITFGTDCAKLTPAELCRIGYVHQEGELLDWMKVKQLIRYVAAYYPSWNTELEEEYIKDFDLPLNKRVASLSPGQRQKLAILLAIGYEPELLILDEPAAGLDPIARSDFLDLLLEIIQDASRSIIISSHILSDVEKVIDHAIVMDSGKIVADCSYDSLLEKFHSIKLTSLNGSLPENLPFNGIIDCQKTDKTAILTLAGSNQDQVRFVASEINCDIEISTLPLEDIYRIIISEKMEV